ncbi:MAG: hypothetical protein KGM98_07520 [Bacteroidota bacterium]|nr:hypothetical protein [Bacteroidota bacterium]
MKKLILLLIPLTLLISKESRCQTRKGNILLGGDFANFDLGLQKGAGFQMRIDPKLGIFFHDHFAMGAYASFNYQNVSKSSSITFGAGLLSRFYTKGKSGQDGLDRSSFFFEITAGLAGSHITNGTSTDGLGLGAGPGYTFFLSPNIGLETLLKYDGLLGFGSKALQSDLNLNIGFQIYLDSHKMRKTVTEDMDAKHR